MTSNRFTCVLLLALLTGSARAALVGEREPLEKPNLPPASALGKIRDLAATVRARRALQEDRILSTLNLGVHVENGVATIWGPVPSSVIARQAISRIENLTGIAEVRPSFYLRQAGDPLDLSVRPQRTQAAKPDLVTGKLPPAPLVIDDSATLPQLGTPRPHAQVRPGEVRTVAEARPRRVASLSDEIQRIRSADRRFTGIRIEVDGTTVIVYRGEVSGESVMELSRQIRRLAGVDNVVLAAD